MSRGTLALIGVLACTVPLAAQVTSELAPGARDTRAVVRVTNTSAATAIESPSLTVATAPTWIVNVRILPDGTGPVAPGASRAFSVAFDVAADAPAGAEDTIVFAVTADGGPDLDQPNPSIRVRVRGGAAPAATNATPAAAAAAPLVLQLAEIAPPYGVSSDWKVDFRAAVSCFALRSVRGIKSYCFGNLPTEIRAGDPFTIAVEGRIRVRYPDGHACGERSDTPLGLDNSQNIAARVQAKELEIAARGTADLRSYCDEGEVDVFSKAATDKDDAVRLALAFEPAGHAEGTWLYRGAATTTGLVTRRRVEPAVALLSGPRPELDIETVEGVILKYRVSPARPLALSRGSHAAELATPPRNNGPLVLVTRFYVASVKGRGFTLNWGGGSWTSSGSHDVMLKVGRGESPEAAVARLKAELETVRCPLQATHAQPWPQLWESLSVALKAGPFRTDSDAAPVWAGNNWMRETSPGPSGEELARRFRCTPVTTTAESGTDPSRATGAGRETGRTSGGATTSSGAAAPDPTDASIATFTRNMFIREWIDAAEPPENATEGARFRYSPWGLKVGDSAVSSIRETPGRPDDAGGRTPEEYVWSKAGQLDSVNHCTLDEFVRARLAGASIDACRGRYRAAVAAARAVPDVRGRKAQEAVAALTDMGLTPRLAGGSPAPTPEREFTVEGLRPAPGTRVPAGGEVVVLVHSRFESPAMPNLAGLTVAEAESRLRTLGATVRRVGGDPAPRPELAFRVQSHAPGPGEPLSPGAAVDLRIHSAYQAEVAPGTAATPRTGTVPSFVGLDRSEASRRLAGVGRAIPPPGGWPFFGLPRVYAYEVDVPGVGRLRAEFTRVPFTIGATIGRVESQQPPPGTPLAPGMTVGLTYVGQCPVLDNRPPVDKDIGGEPTPGHPEWGIDLTCWVWGRSGEPSSLKLNVIRNEVPRGTHELNPSCGAATSFHPNGKILIVSGTRNVRVQAWGEGQFANMRQAAPSLMPLLQDLIRANEPRSEPCR